MPQPLLILEIDQELAHQRVAEIEQALRDMAPELEEALNQSSETWHDNAPFEVLRDKRALYLSEITNIKTMLANATKQLPRVRRGAINVGSTITIRNTQTNQTASYYIAGDWTLRTGEQHEGAMVISRAAPLGQLVIGKRSGERVVLNGRTLVIQNVE